MLVPKLRFKREDGTEYPEWSKNKWSDLGSFVGSGTLSKSDLTKEGTPCILYGELYTKYREIAHTIYSKTNATSHSFSQADDVILPKSGETPEDISTATCIPYDGISLGGDLIVFRHNEKVTGAYLSYLISNRAKNAIASIAQGKSVVHINEKALSNIELPYPQIEEQQKIADFLSTVDEVIAQSEAEVQNLEQQKKAAMQKIFLQEVRFKREDGTEYPEWKKKTISELFEISAGGDIDKANSTKEYSKDYPYAVYANALTNKGLYGYANYYKVERDCFTVTGRGDVGYAVARHEKFVPIVRLLVCIPKHNENVDFFAEIVNYTNILIESTGVPQLTSIQLGKIKVNYPTDIEEQQKIADFLSAYNEAIGYAKQELDKWKELKKGLLQQMFV
jgi:type I restriction enzyme S subunit